MGGYPHANGHRLYYQDTNFADVVAKQEPYPVRTENIGPEGCAFDEMIEGTPYRSERSHTLGRFLKNGDLMHNPMSGAPGLGDPIDRKPESVVEDVNEGVYGAAIVEQVYGVICRFDESSDLWTLDEAATAKRRADIRDERKANSVPFDRPR